MATTRLPVLHQLALGAALATVAHTAAFAQASGAAPARQSRPPAASEANAALSSADRKFVMEAAKGGMAEVALGQLAEQKGGSAAVKQFGSRIATDHAKANDQLKQLASAKGVELPAEAPKDAHARHLESLSGAAFDREYMSHMVKDHHQDIAAFKKEASAGRDPQIKAFASETLPTLESHLQMAEQTNASLGGKRGGPATRE